MAKIWIDLDNSPHVPFFNPIISQLKANGHEVLVTARDYSQTFKLAELYGIEFKKVGKHYGKSKALKVLGLAVRSLQFVPILISEKPDLAFSHGSRSQAVVAKFARIPMVLAFDYEFTQKLSFIKPEYAMVPEVLCGRDLGDVTHNLMSYPGIKEDVYVSQHTTGKNVLSELGITGEEIIVSIRPPATEAHYHNIKSDILFDSAIRFFVSQSDVKIVILPRTQDQSDEIAKKYDQYIAYEKIVIPAVVVNGLDLLSLSDLVVSAGGTMIREAAALGVPAYSIFGGRIGAVDEFLSSKGRLTLLSTEDDIKEKIILKKRSKEINSQTYKNESMNVIVGNIETILKSLSEAWLGGTDESLKGKPMQNNAEKSDSKSSVSSTNKCRI